MSVVGYLIGLGDRHPFNIMIQRDTAKVVHIDFGDCFEVNKMRKVFP
jgi:FKBP12-rapamycin complex-associated protein